MPLAARGAMRAAGSRGCLRKGRLRWPRVARPGARLAGGEAIGDYGMHARTCSILTTYLPRYLSWRVIPALPLLLFSAPAAAAIASFHSPSLQTRSQPRDRSPGAQKHPRSILGQGQQKRMCCPRQCMHSKVDAHVTH